jgi:hypothetical protein
LRSPIELKGQNSDAMPFRRGRLKYIRGLFWAGFARVNIPECFCFTQDLAKRVAREQAEG